MVNYAPPGFKGPGPGRPKGSPNKASIDLKIYTRKYTPEAVDELVRIALNGETDSVRVQAIRELLDRAYGKATQHIGGDPDAGPIQVSWID